ncbi:gamma-glutamyl-gamma-aminobutyrate hydrolase family protein [Chlamydiales bacterium]|nr:gamma-glutamyl-gamma-aminobutyrate hydrolase family protein [Chlamydiales bacterium]
MNKIVELYRRPRIAVSGPNTKNTLAWFLIRSMLRWLGSTPIYCSPKSQSLPLFDGLILMGGVDVQAHLYGQKDYAESWKDPLRDQLELDLLHHAFRKKKPILGICRGMQLMNIARRGTLHQELGQIFTDFLPNTSLLGKIAARQMISVKKDSLLSTILGEGQHRVNSLHHQGIDKVGINLRPTAWLQNDLIQGIEACDGSWQIGVQWHPEYMIYQKKQRTLFSSFVSSCRSK